MPLHITSGLFRPILNDSILAMTYDFTQCGRVRATSKASDKPAHTRSLISTFAGRLNIL